VNHKLVLSTCAVILFLFFSALSFASDFPNYSAEGLKAKMDQGDEIFLLCPLSDIVFNEKNIPGSVNIPLKEIMKTKKLPRNKNRLIVTYCLGPK
jgi:hypothetical protein